MKPDLYTRMYLWLASHRALVLGVTLLIAIGSLLLSSRIDLEEDVLAILPRNDQLVDDYQYTLRKFRQVDRVYFDVGINRADPDALGQAADDLYARLATNSAYARITYRVEMHGQEKVVNFLTGALPNLFTEADATALAPKLQPAAVRDYLTVMRRKLAGLDGLVLKDVVAADPVGMSSLVIAKVLPLQTGFGDAQLADGRITSGDGRHVLLMAEPKLPSSNSGASAALVDGMLRQAGAVEQKFPGVHVAITGGHRMTVDNATLIKGDATRCIFLGMAAMLILCLAAYRRRWLALITFLPSIFGTLVAGVVLMFWQRHLSAIATGFATIAIGITVDYAIYVVYHLDNAAGLDGPAVGRHVARLVLPITVGALTTMAAFAVMATSPMHGYQQLGVFGMAGVFFSAAFALIILPLLVPIPKKTGQASLWLTRFMDNFHGWQSHGRPKLLILVAALTVAAAFGVPRLRFEGDITKLNGITEATRRDEELIRKTWGDALGMTLVVARGATEDQALAQNDRAAEALSHWPGVSEVYSLASVCPSREDQENYIRRWHEFWNPQRREDLRKNLEQIGGELGFRPDAFAAFWQRLEKDPAILTLESFRNTPLEQALNERVALGPGDNAVSTLLKLKDRAQIAPLRRELAGMIVLDKKDFAEHIAHLAKEGLGRFAWRTAVLVTVIVYLALGSIELAAATLLPLAFALLWTFGVMGWLGLPIDMMNSVFVIFIIGIGEDYSVFMMTSKLDEWRGRPPRLAATSASVVISALTTIFGFAVLVFARHPVLFSMGATVLIGMAFAFAATLILTPLFMDLLLFKEQPRGAPRWWHLAGTAWAAVHLGGSEIFLYCVLRPCLKLFTPASADATLRRATRWMARGVVKGLPFGRLEFRNITPATFDPPCVVVSNHQSAVDVMLMVSLPGDVRQTAKKRIFDTPILGIGCKLLGHVMVEPNDPETTLRRCREKLAGGASVHFYPEGTRSMDSFPRRFHRGAFELAVELQRDILPILLGGTNTAMPRDSYWFEPYHVVVAALPRITPQNFDYAQGSLALMRHCEAVVRRALQEQLDELNTPRVLRRKVERLYRYQGKFVELFVHWKLKLDPMFRALDSMVPRKGFVLDLGCGCGVAANWLAHTTDQRAFLGVDYDADKIRVAQRTAPGHPRVRFEARDILDWEFPPCDTALLLDVLHYWEPEKQEWILRKVRRALRPGGTLVLREAARADSAGHQRVERWEKWATRLGLNKTVEGLHFLTRVELAAALRRAGFSQEAIRGESGRDSNILLTAVAEGPRCSGG
ncbi:MAG TPA: 1-acyl-sn-glycerol-3-phosphate acyltransferase [Verrucomicrobiae bacterium]